jgi:hypothetical protein
MKKKKKEKSEILRYNPCKYVPADFLMQIYMCEYVHYTYTC